MLCQASHPSAALFSLNILTVLDPYPIIHGGLGVGPSRKGNASDLYVTF